MCQRSVCPLCDPCQIEADRLRSDATYASRPKPSTPALEPPPGVGASLSGGGADDLSDEDGGDYAPRVSNRKGRRNDDRRKAESGGILDYFGSSGKAIDVPHKHDSEDPEDEPAPVVGPRGGVMSGRDRVRGSARGSRAVEQRSSAATRTTTKVKGDDGLESARRQRRSPEVGNGTRFGLLVGTEGSHCCSGPRHRGRFLLS